MLAAAVKGLVGPAEYVHVELERGGDGAVGRGGGRARHHLVCLLHLVLLQNIFSQVLISESVQTYQPTFGLVILARFFPWLIEL